MIETILNIIFNQGVWYNVLAGLILILIPILPRLIFFKPKIVIKGIDVSRTSHVITNNKQVIFRHWVEIKINNTGNQKMNQPKLYCLKLINSHTRTNVGLPPVRLKWRGVGSEGDLEHIFPTKVNYHANLGFFEFAINKKGTFSLFLDYLFLDAKIEETEIVQLEKNIQYEALIVIGNGNFLVPPHYANILFSWRPKPNPKPGELPITFEYVVKSQGTKWLS